VREVEIPGVYIKQLSKQKKGGIGRRVLGRGNNRETETKRKKETKSFHVKIGVRRGTVL
jgi:hypothetical protein